MIKLAYIGYIVNEKECLDRKGTSIAGNRMQVGILKTLLKKKNINLTTVSIIPTAPYPIEKKILFGRCRKNVSGLTVIEVPFLNIQIVKQLTQILSSIVELINILLRNSRSTKVLVSYNSNLTTGFVSLFANKILGFKTICFVADPVCNVVNLKGIKKLFWYPFKNLSNKMLKKFNGLIVVNKNTIEKFAPKIPYIVVEGGFSPKEYDNVLKIEPYNIKRNDKFTVFFAGALYEYNGIRKIIQVAKEIGKVRSDINFVIYGDGELKEELEQISASDTNIKYMGLKANSVIREEMMKADILLNLRNMEDEISQYTFPSKIIEYMISGKAIISTEINGMPEEYKQYLNILKTDTCEEIIWLIQKIISSNHINLNYKGIQARNFMLNNKCWDKVGNNVSDFIYKISLNE